jgi:Ion channel
MTIFDLPNWAVLPLTVLLLVTTVVLGVALFSTLRSLYTDGGGRLTRRPMALIGYLALLYLTLVWMFALIYRAIYYYDEASFIFSDVSNFKDSYLSTYYFSVVTITSTGYGDIHPKGSIARLAAMLEMLCGYFFTVLFFSVVAGLARRAKDPPK